MFKTEIGSESVKIKDEPPSRSSPDSSTDPWSCPQCGRPHENESVLLEHLLNDHQIRVVPPQSPSTTRCPVCRKHVADLSQHFALEHGESNQDVKHQLASVPNGATRIIPIVLPSQPAPLSDPERGGRRDLNNVTIIPMTNGNGTSYGSGAGSTRSSTPNSLNNDNPVNLTVRKAEHDDANAGMYIAQAASQLGRKRRKQTHVPDDNKDERYWARRMKNNEAAKKSRDMRIRREKVIFEENIRLENLAKELKAENDILSTENKELHLKMGIILDENARLKELIQEK